MTDPGNDTSAVRKKTLFVRALPDGFTFAATTSKGLFVQELVIPTRFDFPDLLETFADDNDWANRSNLEVSLLDHTDRFMLVPAELKDEAQIRECFRLEFPVQESYDLFFAPFPDKKLLFCWEMPAKRKACFEDLFPTLNIQCSSQILAIWTYRQAPHFREGVVTAHLFGHELQVFVSRSDRFLLANTFQVGNPEEIVYFLLRIYDQLVLDPHRTPLYLCTEGRNFDDIEELLSPYLELLRECRFTDCSEDPFVILNPFLDYDEDN